ncbi:MAG: ABC transporter substrate-binding protein, partial [Gemmatimonadota bacterium]
MTRFGALLGLLLLGAVFGCASREPLPPTLSGEPISRADAEAAEAAYETGVARFEAGAYATALPEFTRVVEAYPSSRYGGLALYWQGRTLYQMGRDAEAIPALDRYLRLSPTVPHREHAALLLSNSHYGVRGFDEALISALLVERASPERLDDFLDLSRDLLQHLSRPAIEGVSGRRPARNFLAPFYLQSARWAFAAGDTLRGRELARQMMAFPELPAEILAEARGLVGADAAPVVSRPRLGFIATTESRFADVIEQIQRGIELALEDVNDQRATPVELLVRATASHPDSTIGVIRALARTERVEAILGPMISEMAIPAGRAAAEEGVTLVSPTATDARLLDIGPQVYSVNALDGAIGHTLGTYAVRTLEKRRFAILAVDNPYGRVQAEAFATAIQAAGARVVVRHDYPPGATQFTSHLGDVMRSRADAIFIATKSAGEALRILNQMAFYELY